MKYVTLGRAAVRVSRLCLGTMSFGSRTNKTDSFTILNAAIEQGINFIDTANSYGRRGAISSEEILGEWLVNSPGLRDSLVIATKVCAPLGNGPNEGGLSAKHVRYACEESLRRLKTDYIDLYQMHHIDRSTCWEEIWQIMGQLQREGKILYVGSSNFAGWHIAQASEAARRWNLLGLVSEQSVYNLANRAIELEVIPACISYGMALLTYSPLGGGVLAGILDKTLDTKMRSISVHSQRLLEQQRNAVERYESLCQAMSLEPAVLGLAWLLSRNGVTVPVIGPRMMNHLDSALRAFELSLDNEVLTQLDTIFPGPGGAAPEAYSW